CPTPPAVDGGARSDRSAHLGQTEPLRSQVVAPAEPVPPAAPASPAASARRRSSAVKLVMPLGAMAALGALTTDMYLPSLPEVVVDLAAGEASVQFTITATLIGGAVGQLLIGPLSDRYGRRAPVLV